MATVCPKGPKILQGKVLQCSQKVLQFSEKKNFLQVLNFTVRKTVDTLRLVQCAPLSRATVNRASRFIGPNLLGTEFPLSKSLQNGSRRLSGPPLNRANFCWDQGGPIKRRALYMQQMNLFV